MKVLVVDDSELIQKRVVEVLTENEAGGLEISLAATATEAYDSIKKTSPDIVILDIHLPGENGIHILEYIRNEDNKVKIVMLTNFPYPQYRRKCINLGADYFLDKNTEFEKLSKVLNEIQQNANN